MNVLEVTEGDDELVIKVETAETVAGGRRRRRGRCG